MKYCNICRNKKKETEFYWQNKSEGVRNGTCKKCSNNLNKDWYIRNREKQLLAKKEYRERTKKISRTLVLEYLRTHPCTVCGETDPVVLDFDHNDPTKKVLAIAALCTRSYNLRKLVTEMKKCSVLCANCHRRKTAKQFGYFKYLQSLES